MHYIRTQLARILKHFEYHVFCFFFFFPVSYVFRGALANLPLVDSDALAAVLAIQSGGAGRREFASGNR